MTCRELGKGEPCLVTMQKFGVLVLCFGLVKGAYVDDEASLRTAVFSNYNPSIRPNDTTSISMEVFPLSLVSLDIGEQQMSMSEIILLAWSDYRLAWNPSSYGGIEHLIESTTNVWIPSFVVENSVLGEGGLPETGDNNIKLRIFHTGEVNWIMLLYTTTSCEMAISNYPFDAQTCSITFTNWAYHTALVHTVSSAFDLTYMEENGEWEMRSLTVSSGHFVGSGPTLFTRTFYTFTYRRRWQFYGLNLMMPIVLTAFMMCAVFTLPIDTGEKMGYCLTVLLSYAVYLTWITDNLPAISSDISVLQVYLAIVLVLGVLAALLTIWVLALHHRPQSVPMSRPMEVFVRKVLVPYRNWTCCKKSEPREENPGDAKQTNDTKLSKVAPLSTGLPNTVKFVLPCQEPEGMAGPEELFTTEKEKVTWQEVAVMLDKLFLVISLSLIISLSTIIVIVMYARYFSS